MKEKDIIEEIIDTGKRRGSITYEEINDALPSEYYTPDELEDLIDLLHDMGIEVIDEQETDTPEDEILVSEEKEEYDETEDLIQAYFHSMGNISILTRNEEIELAKILEEGEKIIKGVVTQLPLYKKLEASLDGKDEENLKNTDEDKTDEVLEMSLKVLDNLILKIAVAERKVARYGTLKDLKKLIHEKKKQDINSIKLTALAKEIQSEYRHVESEVGIKIDELKEKWERITKAKILVSEAKNELITRNLRLVVNVAKNYIGRGLSLLDLIQEGNIGLMKAIDKFDYKMGFKFSTYATWWIRQAVSRAVADQGRTIRVPVHMGDQLNRMRRVQLKLLQELGRDPKIEELAEGMETTPEKVENLLEISRRPVSLETPIDDDGDSTFGDFVEDTNSLAPAEEVTTHLLQEQLQQALDKLPPREAQILRLRYGLADGRVYTLEEVGQTIGVTRERVRQLEAQALNRLRQSSAHVILKDYLFEA